MPLGSYSELPKKKIIYMIKDKTLKILTDPFLSKGAVSVALYLLNSNGIWKKGQRELSHILGVSQRQLLDNLKLLEDRKYLEKEIDPIRRNTKIYKLKGVKNGA